jgi:uncharacterized protein with von Willebrand factor type A (vWA) domain
VARAHWRRDLTTSTDLAAAALPSGLSAEFASVMAETHASLLDPAGVAPLPSPSPIGVAVNRALTGHPDWQTLCDAATLHPSIARDAVVSLADAVKNAFVKAGATKDARRVLGDLERAREALRKARQRRDDADAAAKADPSAENRAAATEARRAALDAGEAEEKASAAVQAAESAAARLPAFVDAAAVADVAAAASERAGAIQAMIVAGLGDALGSNDATLAPDDLVTLLSVDVARVLRKVGALRLALRANRAARHLPGREGCEGTETGGVDRIGDLLPVARAALAGHLGTGAALWERYRLVTGRAAVMAKGGGEAADGDAVVVVDKSGSMTCEGREEAAAALALTILLECRAANRVCGVVTYDGQVRTAVVVDSPAAFRVAFAAIVKGSGGDNNEARALKAAGGLLRRMRNGGDSADVVMITDGQWSAKNMAGSGVNPDRLSCVLIGGTAPQGARFKHVWEVRQLDDRVSIEVAAAIV